MGVNTELLKSMHCFAGLTPAELESIRQSIFEKTAQRGEMILLEGEPVDALYFVASGAVKIFKTSPEGKEQILTIARPGQALNSVAVFDHGPNPASAQAMAVVLLYGLKDAELRVILEKYPKTALNVITVLAQQARQLISLVEDLSFRHVTGRVAKILLEHALDGGHPGQRLTQQEMAAMAGTAREVVARSLKALENEGAIKLDRHRIIIADKRLLTQMVEWR